MKYLLIIFFSNFLFGEFNEQLFTEKLKEKPREERKGICLSKMNSNIDTNPKIAYFAANCLLYNGYGDLSIPLFTKYIYGKNNYNEKYFNNRIGYGWLHSADWYNVGSAVLSTMTNGKDIYEWITAQIEKELIKNPLKYDISKSLFVKFKKITSNEISKETITIFKECKQISIFIDNYKCSYTRKKRFFDCKKGFTNNQVAICND